MKIKKLIYQMIRFPLPSYGYLKMSFSEMTEVMKGNLSLEEIQQVKSYMDNVTNFLLKRKQDRSLNNRSPKGTIASSNTPF